MSNYRQILLNESNGEMWQSNYTPAQQGLKHCGKVGCPDVNGYDKMDTCYKCAQPEGKEQSYLLWPHVKN